ncbi:hypothetical protein [Actinoplanes sp. NPDC049681]|uniref:hypothetical protein n=1 Tax=Actinoplanes sp. NPDC049681 TaxID=3363905 RepID=UPI0037B089D6
MAGAVVAAVVATAGVTAAVVGSGGGNGAPAAAAPGGNGAAVPGGGEGMPGGVPDGRDRGQFPGAGRGGGMAGALHGTYVVSDGSGGYVTQETQSGTVSKVGATSLTVKSADGYSRTYVVGSATVVDNGADKIADVAAGHTVRVVATTSGDTATATTIVDSEPAAGTTAQGGDQQGGFPGGPGGGLPGGNGQGGTQGGSQGGTATGT